jgi:hypothetical protein
MPIIGIGILLTANVFKFNDMESDVVGNYDDKNIYLL